MGSPALTEEASAVLVKVIAAQFTVMLVNVLADGAVPEPSLVVAKLAWLATVPPQVAVVVGEEMCTLKVLPGPGLAARSTGPQFRVLGEVVVIEQAPLAGLIVQARPALAGRTSEMVKPWAMPAPVLVAEIV